MSKTILSTFLVATLAAAFLAPAALGADKDDSKASKASKDKPYTIDTCIVSDEKLGEMGEPFVTAYKGQEIKMCCKSCNKDFTKNPDKYLKKLADASKAKDKKK